MRRICALHRGNGATLREEVPDGSQLRHDLAVETREIAVAEFVEEFGKDGTPVEADGRLDAAAFHRNHEPIWSVLKGFLMGRSGDVLEAGSGTGQHVVYFAGHTPDITWWPSDLNASHLRSIAAWRAHAGLANIRPPQRIDLSDPAWSAVPSDGRGPDKLLAIFCANVIHIAPWRVAEGLFAGAGRHLRPDGRLFLYGPFKRDGKHTALSNAVFDTSLRERDAEWGVRDIVDLEQLADSVGLGLADTFEMPSNNMILMFVRR
jgi:SAM-dependent methyltransferase